jgi:hypothetical protein
MGAVPPDQAGDILVPLEQILRSFELK